MIITVTPNPSLDKVYWVDRLKIGDQTQEEFLTRATRSHMSAGGKGVNISVFLARMGVENVAMGFIGGHVGQVVVRDLRNEGVSTNFVWVEGETRTNVTILERGREYVPIQLNEAGPQISQGASERFLRRYGRILPDADWMVLAGSLPPGLDSDFYYKLAKETGAKVVISAGGEALSRSLDAAPYLVKPDTRQRLAMEGARLTSRERIIAAGRRVIEQGVEVIIISHGVTGDIAISRDGIWDIKARISTTQFKNLVGADDALVGGIIYRLDEGAGFEEALRFGMAAAILSAEGDEKICHQRERIEAEMEQISVERYEEAA
ncbi:MAG: 1-phosphofructokinase family hexose kinase [Candidatus Bipolaricaulota bacterium]|nr:1-phosphofructokinase family hexose kinase [Candidatus Bipolaricaulota bacterium]